jgi:hypothetical protein
MTTRHKLAVLLGLSILAAGALVLRPGVPAPPSFLTLSGDEAHAVRRAAHSLKTSSAALGAATLAVLSGDLAAAARHANHALPAPASVETDRVRVDLSRPAPDPRR